MKCPSCGAERPDGELVCQECNNYLNLTQEELERVERYRLSTHTELLCVMFCDVSGFTTIANRSLSQSQRILAIHSAIVQTIVERDGGEIVNTAGDGILVVFSNPATATESALRIHETVYQFYARMLEDAEVISALQRKDVRRAPGPHDLQHSVHIGLHLGIVTRGGRTSRDVFGHNVNITCRLCSLADAGQTYMSTPVYDNARLIIGDRPDLTWQSWPDLTIRGISETMTVVGLAQQPYTTIAPPRGVSLRRAGDNTKLTAMLVSAGLVALAVIVYLVMLVRQLPKPPTLAEIPHALGTTAAQDTLPPVVVTINDESHADDPGDAKPGDTPAVTPPADTQANTSSSAVVRSTPPPTPPADTTPGLPTPEKAPAVPDKPAPGVEKPATSEPAPVAVVDPEVRRFFPMLMKAGAPIWLGDDQRKTPGTLIAMKGKDGLLLAIGVEGKTADGAQMAVAFDGNNDGKLQSEDTSPYLDFMLGVGASEGKKGLEVHALRNNLPVKALPAINHAVGRAVTHGTRTIWIFRVPYAELGVSSGMMVRFRIDYTLDAGDEPLYHPPSVKGTQLRSMVIP